MKKVILTLLVAVTLTTVATAQKNTVLLYGEANLYSYKDNNAPEYKQTGLTFAPGIGYQFNNNWTAGVQARIGNTKFEWDNNPTPGATTTRKEPSFNVGPFVRYTKSLSNLFSIYGQLDLSYTSRKRVDEVSAPASSVTSRWNGFDARIVPAIQVHVKNGFALNFNFGGLGYNTEKSTATASKSVDNFDFNFGQVVGIGVSKNFSTKKK